MTEYQSGGQYVLVSGHTDGNIIGWRMAESIGLRPQFYKNLPGGRIK